MRELLVENIDYPGLADVFSPPGFRLVEKSEGAPPTTSVLIRGAAGTGKTTLGLAVARAIAVASGGIAVFVSSEASLADAAYKSQVLKFDIEPLLYRDRAGAGPGAVVLASLVGERDDAVEAGPEQLVRILMDHVHGLVSSHQGLTPISAVVVDSFELPENVSEAVGRSDLVAFVQSLEGQGINPVFIEEVGGTTSDRLTFIVDVVLRLSLEAEESETALHRKLTVLKSRYSHAVAGPHDMAIDDGRPTVWPDSPSLDFGGAQNPIGFVFPNQTTGSIVSINRGALILSRYDVDGQTVLRGIHEVPGLIAAQVYCGPVIRMTNAKGGNAQPISSMLGPSAFAWALHRALSTAQTNCVIFHKLEYLLAHPRFARALPATLFDLTERGILVCVHGTSKGLTTIDEIADFSTTHILTSDEQTPLDREYRLESGWVVPFPGIAPRPARNPEELRNLRSEGTKAAELAANGKVRDALNALTSHSNSDDPAIQRDQVERALFLHRLGKSSDARAKLDGILNRKPTDVEVKAVLAWAYAEIGAEWQAHRLALEGLAHTPRIGAFGQLWRACHLRYSSLATSVEYHKWSDPIQARLAAQAAARREHTDVADELLRRSGHTQHMPAERLARLYADVRLESREASSWQDAEERYAELSLGDLSILDRADITFNRGVIRERLGDPAGAVSRFQEALGLNPCLDLAASKLAAHHAA